MEQILKLYQNNIGIAFQWKSTQSHLIQIIFRDTGFHLTVDDITRFVEKLTDAKYQAACSAYHENDSCKSLLLQTPSNRVSLAVSFNELSEIEDLLRGTLFQIRLNKYLSELFNA